MIGGSYKEQDQNIILGNPPTNGGYQMWDLS